MLLYIEFDDDPLPLVMSDTEEACMKAIDLAKEEYCFNPQTATISPNYIYLQAHRIKYKSDTE